ncbi:Hermansky-Pudlak syndrome 1 protein [Bradysia coprophila]|uniref:Hermansky-Pudlak syndrome 1 protein n=1 Tax=Bradysia coprophila TaxID=38358 RepID=UPI00187D99C8|nr:Hermansky-Pudlak syndrome 1 protein [Bradysia coprophila]
MDGLLIFDQQNDVIYTKFNEQMKTKLHELALEQELVETDAVEKDFLNPNVLIQIFSPIIASQRIMTCQFDNSYSSLECDGNINFVFEEFLGFVFLKIGMNSIKDLQRSVGVCSCFIKRICGPDIYLLKTMPHKSEMLTKLLLTWDRLYETDQAVRMESVEHLLVNLDLKNIAQKTLEIATENLKQDPHSQRSHACLFVRNKFFSMFSSKQAQELSPSDILFITIFIQSLESLEKKISTNLLFLQGNVNGSYAGCIPHIVHVSQLDNDIILVLLIEYGNLQVASGLYDAFFAMHKTRNLQMQNDVDGLRPAFDKLESSVKHVVEALKKAKFNSTDIDNSTKKFVSRWDVLKKKYIDLFKNCDKDLVVTIESNLPGFVEALKELFRVTCIECNSREHGIQRVSEISSMVEGRLLEFGEFLLVKSQQNFTLGSYLEEFPGLVHFIHIDRSTGRLIAPNIAADNPLITANKIWSMVDFSRSYLQKGHMSVIWKDTAFSYSYFLWFEDHNGCPMKPKELPNTSVQTTIKPQVVPGILSGEFYQWLIEVCFPKQSKVKCFELYCVHLGLASASCVLEHNRRLAATITEVTGLPAGIIDVL